MELPADLESRERKIQENWKDITKTNQILKSLTHLERCKVKGVKIGRRASKKRRLRVTKLKRVSHRCTWFLREWYEHCERLGLQPDIKVGQDQLEKEYLEKIYSYLQGELIVTFSLRDSNVKLEEIADVLFYYLVTSSEPNQHLKTIIKVLSDLEYHDLHSSYNWLEMCCCLLYSTVIFKRFYARLGNEVGQLRYFLDQQPELLLNVKSDYLINNLIEYLPFYQLHIILTQFKDKRGRTHAFYIYQTIPYIKLYRNHIDDFYELLSVPDTNGQTALFVNTFKIFLMLSAIYTPNQRTKFISLVSIRDNNGQTALDVVTSSQGHYELLTLKNQVRNNEYVTMSDDMNVLIIYSNVNRSQADEEAQLIYNACNSNYYSVQLEKNKKEDEILELIRSTANKMDHVNDLPPAALIVILMSHGGIGTIDDCEGNPMKFTTIEEAMCSEPLSGRPKMLITQCCQNTQAAVDESKTYAPTHDHFCAVMSCVPGQKSKRGIFLTKFAERVQGHTSGEVNVFKLASQIGAQMQQEGHPQTPIIMSTLKAEFRPIDDYF